MRCSFLIPKKYNMIMPEVKVFNFIIHYASDSQIRVEHVFSKLINLHFKTTDFWSDVIVQVIGVLENGFIFMMICAHSEFLHFIYCFHTIWFTSIWASFRSTNRLYLFWTLLTYSTIPCMSVIHSCSYLLPIYNKKITRVGHKYRGSVNVCYWVRAGI